MKNQRPPSFLIRHLRLNAHFISCALLALCVPLTATAAETTYLDKTPPANTYNGSSSTRFAKPVTVVIDKKIGEKTMVSQQNKPGSYYGKTKAVKAAIKKYSLSSARRHFEEAKWPLLDKNGKAKKKHATKGRDVVIRRISVEGAQGPSYTVVVEVDRVIKGRRKGSATGRGFGTPDRTAERTRAAYAPGIFGAMAGKKAGSPKPAEDARVIEQATLRALDSAFLQLAAVWSGEQMVEDMQRKHRR